LKSTNTGNKPGALSPCTNLANGPNDTMRHNIHSVLSPPRIRMTRSTSISSVVMPARYPTPAGKATILQVTGLKVEQAKMGRLEVWQRYCG
jgi:hypothetical protein